MCKKSLGIPVLALVMGLIFSFCISSCFAEESFTITTYYPSPYGNYNELKTNKMAVGDTAAPDTSGVMRFEVRANDPSGANDMQDGPTQLIIHRTMF